MDELLPAENARNAASRQWSVLTQVLSFPRRDGEKKIQLNRDSNPGHLIKRRATRQR